MKNPTLSVLALLTLAACGSSEAPAPAPEPAAEAPAPAPAPPAAGEVLVSGIIELEGDAPEAKAMFVSIRGEAGPPLAAKMLPPGPFPMKFELTTADLMSMGGPPPTVPPSFNLKVALDGDGNAMTKEPLPRHVGPVDKGATGITAKLAPPE